MSRSNAVKSASKIRRIGQSLTAKYIARQDAIEAVELALVAGEHCVMLGPPGTAKSAIVRSFASAMGLSFFRRLLNPDTKREDLVGPIDPSALTEGRWDRAWMGLATNDIVFLDEIGKASNQVINITLDAMEERVVTSGDKDRDIPLKSLFSASNETLDDAVEAAWDRFTLRVVCKYIDRTADFVSLLTRSSADDPTVKMTSAEMAEMRDACRAMADSASDAVVESMVKLWQGLANVTSERVSDRRWKRILTVAAAHALLSGRDEIEPADLVVARFMLWQRIDEIDVVQGFVMDEVNVEHAEWKAADQLVQEIEELAATAQRLEEKSRVTYRAQQLVRSIGDRNGTEDWDGIRTRLAAVQEMVL